MIFTDKDFHSHQCPPLGDNPRTYRRLAEFVNLRIRDSGLLDNPRVTVLKIGSDNPEGYEKAFREQLDRANSLLELNSHRCKERDEALLENAALKAKLESVIVMDDISLDLRNLNNLLEKENQVLRDLLEKTRKEITQVLKNLVERIDVV